MKKSSNLNISCKVVFYLNKWNKKVGSPSSFGRKRPFLSLNSCAFIAALSSSERARARARANPAKRWCAERMRNAIEWNHLNETKNSEPSNSLWRRSCYNATKELRGFISALSADSLICPCFLTDNPVLGKLSRKFSAEDENDLMECAQGFNFYKFDMLNKTQNLP